MNRKKLDAANMPAFTVKWVWAWLIMKGVKDIENRRYGPVVPKGTCAVTFSKANSRALYDACLEALYEDEVVLVPPYEELKQYAGKVVGVVDYEVLGATNSHWWDRESTPILLKRPKWLRNPFPVTGALGIWKMKPADAHRLIAEL